MRLIPEQETLTVEFKSDIARYPDSDIFEAVVAFANTDGGDLYLGIEDDGTITGVNEAHKNPITLRAPLLPITRFLRSRSGPRSWRIRFLF